MLSRKKLVHHLSLTRENHSESPSSYAPSSIRLHLRDLIEIELSYKTKQGKVTYSVTTSPEDHRTLNKIKSLKGEELIDWFMEHCPIRTLKRKNGKTEFQVSTAFIESAEDHKEDYEDDEDEHEGDEDENMEITAPSRLYA
jgi:hypothetical protein